MDTMRPATHNIDMQSTRLTSPGTKINVYLPSPLELKIRQVLRLPLTYGVSGRGWTYAGFPTTWETASLKEISSRGAVEPLELPQATGEVYARARRVERRSGFNGDKIDIRADAKCDNGFGGLSVTATRAPAPARRRGPAERLLRLLRLRTDKDPVVPAPPRLVLSARRPGEENADYSATLGALGGEMELSGTPREKARVDLSAPVRGAKFSTWTEVAYGKEVGRQVSAQAAVRGEGSRPPHAKFRIGGGKSPMIAAGAGRLGMMAKRDQLMLTLGGLELNMGKLGPSAELKTPLGCTTLSQGSIRHSVDGSLFGWLEVAALPKFSVGFRKLTRRCRVEVAESASIEAQTTGKVFRLSARVAAPRTGWLVGKGDKDQWLAALRFGWFF